MSSPVADNETGGIGKGTFCDGQLSGIGRQLTGMSYRAVVPGRYRAALCFSRRYAVYRFRISSQ